MIHKTFLTHPGIQRQMGLRPELLDPLSSRLPTPVRRNASMGWGSFRMERNRGEVLQQPDHEERHLVVCELRPLRYCQRYVLRDVPVGLDKYEDQH
jgi:hypothetical protein